MEDKAAKKAHSITDAKDGGAMVQQREMEKLSPTCNADEENERLVTVGTHDTEIVAEFSDQDTAGEHIDKMDVERATQAQASILGSKQ